MFFGPKNGSYIPYYYILLYIIGAMLSTAEVHNNPSAFL